MKTNKIIEQVREFMGRHNMTACSNNLIIGLSGGADSVCLLYIIDRLKKTTPEYASLNLYAVHVNHGIRGEEADADEEFSKQFCEKLGITFISRKIDIPAISRKMKLGTEQCARMERYKVFREEARKCGKALIATAHHKNDLAETAIFNMARGTGLKGAAGIGPVNEDVIRPLLCLTRKEIEEFNKENNLGYVTDSTNADTVYKRNLIRNKIIPLLEEVNAGSIEHIAAFCDISGRAYEYLNSKADELFKKCDGIDENNITVSKAILNNENLILELLYKKIITFLKGDSLDISSNRLNEISKFAKKVKASDSKKVSGEKKIIEITNNIKVQADENALIFFRDSIEKSVKKGAAITEPIPIITHKNQKKLESGEAVNIEREEFIIELKLTENFIKNSNADYTKYFDYDKIKANACLRNREIKDVLTVNKNGIKHSLKQELIDRKVPKEDRDGLPLVACGNEVLWIIGVRAGCAAMVDTAKRNSRILKIEFRWK